MMFLINWSCLDSQDKNTSYMASTIKCKAVIGNLLNSGYFFRLMLANANLLLLSSEPTSITFRYSASLPVINWPECYLKFQTNLKGYLKKNVYIKTLYKENLNNKKLSGSTLAGIRWSIVFKYCIDKVAVVSL